MESNLFDPDAPQIAVVAVREFVDAAAWRVAKTDTSEHPHSYLMRHMAREQGLLPGFYMMTRFINLYGFERAWRRRVFKSIDLDGFSYWLQDLPEAHSFATDIVNRKAAEHGGWNRNQLNRPRL